MTKHTYVTRTDEIKCDFCSGPTIAYRYPCVDTVALAVTAAGALIAGVASTDDWAACAACAPVVDAKDPAALARWIVSHPPGPQEVLMMLLPEFRSFMLRKLTDLYTELLPVLGKPIEDSGEGVAVSIRVVDEDNDRSGTK